MLLILIIIGLLSSIFFLFKSNSLVEKSANILWGIFFLSMLLTYLKMLSPHFGFSIYVLFGLILSVYLFLKAIQNKFNLYNLYFIISSLFWIIVIVFKTFHYRFADKITIVEIILIFLYFIVLMNKKFLSLKYSSFALLNLIYVIDVLDGII